MSLRSILFLAAAVWAVRPASAVPLPLQDGEQLNYRVSWTVVPGAGEIKVAAAHDPAAEQRLLVTTTTATRRLAKMLLPFEARAQSTFDRTTGKLISLQERSATRNKQQEHSVAFDYAGRAATYTKQQPAQPPRVLPMPEGDPADLIMALLQTRTWNLQPGEKRDALVLFDDDFYELTLHALRYETIRTGLGEFNTLVLEPRMEKGPPKGMFKRGSTVRVWIAQDERRLPVRFEVEFKIGTGTATLESYQPPATAAARAAVPDAPRAGS